MQFRFTKHAYQLAAVDAVVRCFGGQMNSRAAADVLRPPDELVLRAEGSLGDGLAAFANTPLLVPEPDVLSNVQDTQRLQGIEPSGALCRTAVAPVNLDIEMETGTGKTYCYIRTMFEMYRHYGWSKYVVAVPSIAIREGVHRAFRETAEHFQEEYGCRARCIIYDSRKLEQLHMFDTDASICVMIINAQAFNSTSRESRRIYEELDAFQSRRPIDVIAAARPVVVIDEPQKMEGAATLNGLAAFRPLFALRYSATHRTFHNCVYRLDALAAYRQKLVKKIAVRGITVRGLPGTNPYLYVSHVIARRQRDPSVSCEIEVRGRGGITRATRLFSAGDSLYTASGRLEQYRRFIVGRIDAHSGTVLFTNGIEVRVGEATGDVSEASVRRVQIREAIACHLEKEAKLFSEGIKVLTLFFIDTVAKYRRYSSTGEAAGEYASVFEEEYAAALKTLAASAEPSYKEYLDSISPADTHRGYFSVDRRTQRMTDPEVGRRGETAGEANDVSAYDLILKDKSRLLSLKEPVRFLFSHSALREGWDNPNVFVICTLKRSDSTVSRRQEIGRGLRLCVKANGERVDDPATTHDVNVLTVVANESYSAFVAGLQGDIRQTLRARIQAATAAYFEGRVLHSKNGDLHISAPMARRVYRFLVQHNYVDDDDLITDQYKTCRNEDRVAAVPPPFTEHREPMLCLIDSLYRAVHVPVIANDRARTVNTLTANFGKKQFRDLWEKINRIASYSVSFESSELILKCIARLNETLQVTRLNVVVHSGELRGDVTDDMMRDGTAFVAAEHHRYSAIRGLEAAVKVDLVGRLANSTRLRRSTVAQIICGMQADTFAQYRENPEDFVTQAEKIIADQQAAMLVEHVQYDPTRRRHSIDIFTANLQEVDSTSLPRRLRHIYEYVVTASEVEREFVDRLDAASEVVVYAKLPQAFYIPTPVGKYNPDWAIAFKKGQVKHVFFVAETKGTLSSLQLRRIEECKIACARKFFLAACAADVRYDVVTSYERLLDLVT